MKHRSWALTCYVYIICNNIVNYTSTYIVQCSTQQMLVTELPSND